MNDQGFIEEDRLVEIQSKAVEDVAKKTGRDLEFIAQVIQDYTEVFEELEHYVSNEYQEGDLTINAHVLGEMYKKAIQQVAQKQDVDEYAIYEIIQEYSEIIRNELNEGPTNS